MYGFIPCITRLKYSLVQGLSLLKVDDIEFDLLLATVFNFKVKPLQVSSCICIDSHIQVVFILAYFNDCVEIAALKIAVKIKLSALFDCRVHSFEKSSVFRLKVGMKFPKICCHMLIIPS